MASQDRIEKILALLVSYGYAPNGWDHINDDTAKVGTYYALMALSSGAILDVTGTVLGAGSLAANLPLPEGVIVPGNYTTVKLTVAADVIAFITPPEALGTPT